MNTRASAVALTLFAAALPTFAQPASSPNVLAVEHSVPFGTVSGKLLVLGNYMVFVDEQQMGSSFVVAKSAIDNLSADGLVINVQTREPVRNRSGEVTRLNFRVTAGTDPAVVATWYGSGSSSQPVSSAGSSAGSSTPSADGPTYQARHNHRIGACRGRLIVAANQLMFESVENVGHSRRWEYKSIKEMKNSNPYELEVKPFTGGDYEFVLDGNGIDPAGYKALVDKVTAARAGR
jgi:hypothetical protein